MYNYNTASEICSKSRTKSEFGHLIERNTRMRKEGNLIIIRFHDIDIITINSDNDYTIQVHGFKTVTTKQRINQFTPARLSQKKHVWYIDGSFEFFDGITVNQDGEVLNPRPNTVSAADVRSLTRMIAKYKKELIAKFDTLPNPSAGDCWFCSMLKTDDVDHIYYHLQEMYLMQRVAYNAGMEYNGLFFKPRLSIYLDRFFKKRFNALLASHIAEKQKKAA